jgi:hypothetical protein
MSRRNQGPKLRWLAERGAFYITWTVIGRSHKRSTRTADRERAEAIFGDWMHARRRKIGPSDPAEILVTDVLNDYLNERGPKVMARDRIAYAVLALTDFFEGSTVADVTPQTCRRYTDKRVRSAGTVRRELGVLRAAINYAHSHGKMTRPVAVELPERPEPRSRWLTRQEAREADQRGTDTAGAALHAPVYSFGPLHWTTEGSNSLAALATSRSRHRQHRLRDRRTQEDQQEARHGSHSPTPLTAPKASSAPWYRSWLCSARSWQTDRRPEERICGSLQTGWPRGGYAPHP